MKFELPADKAENLMARFIREHKVKSLCLFCVLAFAGGIMVDFVRVTPFNPSALWYRTRALSFYLKSLPTLIAKEPLPNFMVDMKFANWQRLEFNRRQAIDEAIQGQVNYVSENFKKYVKADLNYQQHLVPIKVRLKGSSLDHYRADSFSLRVKVEDGQAYEGMRNFAIAKPERRAVTFYWLLNNFYKREGGIYLRTPLINFILNGKDLGVYAVEEVPNKDMITNNHRREGYILRFSPEYLEERGFADDYTFLTGTVLPDSVTEFVPGSAMHKQVKAGLSLMEQFKQGKVASSQVFNMIYMPRYLALSDLFNGWHGMAWANMRFYFDPVLARFEPVPWDNFDQNNIYDRESRTVRLDDDMTDPDTAFFKHLFADQAMLTAYVSELERFSREGYIEEAMLALGSGWDQYRLQLAQAEPFYDSQRDLDQLHKNRKYIRDNFFQLSPEKLVVNKLAQGWEFSNLHRLPILIDKVSGTHSDLVAQFKLLEGKVLRETNYKQRVDRLTVPHKALSGVVQTELVLHFRILGTRLTGSKTLKLN